MVLEILEYSFIQRALASGVVIAVICSSVGAFLVMRRLALFGDGIAHVAFGGIAAGMLIGSYPVWVALAAAVLGSIGLQKLRSKARISGEIAVAVVLVSGLAVGLILISISGGFTMDLFSFLFGSIILVSTVDMIIVLITGGVILGFLAVFYRPLLLITFNEEMARAYGIRTTLMNYMFVTVAAVMVVTAMRMTGILLVTSLIVLPTITASMFGRSFGHTILISAAISSSSVVLGIFVSYVLDWAPSGTTVVMLLGFLGSTYLVRYVRDRRRLATIKAAAR